MDQLLSRCSSNQILSLDLNTSVYTDIDLCGLLGFLPPSPKLYRFAIYLLYYIGIVDVHADNK